MTNSKLSELVVERIFAAVVLLMLGTSVQAEYLGLLNGRTAAPGDMTELSAELGLVAGDLDRFSYQNIAARINYRLTDETVLIGDIGVSEFSDFDGTPYGLGLLYHLSRQRISDRVEIAGKVSYHRGTYKFGNSKGDLSSLAFEILISGREPLAEDINWYSNVGYHRISADLQTSDSTNELGLGAGLVLSTGPGAAYAGIDYIDEFTFGLGFRYFVQ